MNNPTRFYRIRGSVGKSYRIECCVSIGVSTVAGSTRAHYILAPDRKGGGFDPVGLIAYPVEGIGKPSTWFTSSQAAKADAVKRLKSSVEEIVERNRHLQSDYENAIDSIKGLEWEAFND